MLNVGNLLAFTAGAGHDRPGHDAADDGRRVRPLGGLGLRLRARRHVDSSSTRASRPWRSPSSSPWRSRSSSASSTAFFTTRLKIPSFLVTLGMLLVVRGAALLLTARVPAAHLEGRGGRYWRRSWWATSSSPPHGATCGSTCRSSGSLSSRSILGYILMASKWRQLDPGRGRQSHCRHGARRARGTHQDRALHPDRDHGCLRGHHQLHPRLRREPEQRRRATSSRSSP